MKKLQLLLPMVLALALAACGTQATPEAIPTVSIDTGSQSAPSSGRRASASAVVVPVQKVDLAFGTGGIVKTVEVQEGDSVTAGQPLVTLDATVLEARLAEAEANVLTQESQLAYLIRTGTSQERLDAAQANIDRALAAVEVAKANLALATLTAPFDGVIASVNISVGEFANPGQAVVVMGDLTQFQIETTDLSEKDVPFVKEGQTAVIYIDALDQEFNGKVTNVARVSSTVGGDVVYTVTIAFDEQPENLRWGMSAEVSIETE